ncbi:MULTISPECIES: MFS transporter [Streptomyces]|uniref:MFS transporter n=1 Tax=Streptomyces olivaceus TaxID=47716 RepID=A0A3G8G7L0_STROV|nr:MULTISPECIES: MFS transporter [Streptomyces]AZG02884.1 MFS transporter [Streptomyces olivaceus]MCM8554648.1 MFS transporter [Streptomyces sp. STCH 565 A]WFB84921.1 MFS transporter [Streptomyces olivaceus]WGK49457.1 MFS transporter [Streptomyces sp. B146]
MRKWWPLVAICLGTFMLLVDVTIVTVALPDMATDLGTTLSDLEWVVDIYALALAALLLGVGSSADRTGRKAVYVVGLVIFALASLVCAVAPDAGVLIAARAVQGIGAAGMFGTTIALLGMHYERKDRNIAFAVWGATNAVAAAAGPVVGGVLTEYLDWRWIFFVNLPLSVLAVVMSVRVLHEVRLPARERVDWMGSVSFTVAAGALTYGLIRAHTDSWTAPFTLALFGFAALALIVFLVAESRHDHPILDLSLFRRASFTGIMTAALFLQAAAFAYLLFTSLWLQSVLGYGPVKAGLYILPMCGAAFVASALAGRLGPWPPRLAVGIGLLLIAAGAALQAVLDADSTGNTVMVGLIVSGLGVGAATPSLSEAALASVPAERGGMAGGAVNTFRQLGFALGIAVFGAIFQARVEHVLRGDGRVPDPEQGAAALSGGQAQAVISSSPPGERDAVGHLVRSAFASALNTTLVVAAAVAAFAALLVFVTVRGGTRDTGAEADPTGAGTPEHGLPAQASP